MDTSFPACAEGFASTNMVEQLTVSHPFGSVAVTQYVLVMDGVATGFAQSVQLKVFVGPDHSYVELGSIPIAANC